jgi:hypothetical protein
LMDLEDGQAANFDYRHEVRNRVIIERLFEFELAKDRRQKDLQNVDRLLRSLVIQSEFIWPEQLQPLYPSQGNYNHCIPHKPFGSYIDCLESRIKLNRVSHMERPDYSFNGVDKLTLRNRPSASRG